MAKIVNGRINNKHDIEANWNRAKDFIPLIAEIIVFDVDDTHDHERFKIGDGESYLYDLPFYLEDELNDVWEAINHLKDNMLDATFENGVLQLKKGIVIP